VKGQLACRFADELDSDKWISRLHIYGVDLHLPSVSAFITHVLREYPYLDILINNAAQTI